MGLVENNNRSVSHNSKTKLFAIVVISAVAFILLFVFAIYPAISRGSKETVYRQALQSHENEELMSEKLANAAKLHYEKGNFDSIKPYIEETTAIYSDGNAKLEVLNDVNEMLYAADDWASLRQLYDLMVEIAEDYELDEGTISYFRMLASKAREHEL